jgi:predicted secreted protein
MVSSIVLYLMIWWIVLFTVLPFGIQKEDQQVDGCDKGAPKKTHLRIKLLATSIIALILWSLATYILNKHFNIHT